VRLIVGIKVIYRQIDEAVYALYGLTEDEIKIVEGGKIILIQIRE
jgi:hypothetical protein